MDDDDVIERAAKALCEASGGFWRTGEGLREPFASDQRALNNHWRYKVRAVAPILMEYGARLMLADLAGDPVMFAAQRARLVQIDPATIVREAVK